MGRYNTMGSREYLGAFVPFNINTNSIGNAHCFLNHAIVLRSMLWKGATDRYMSQRACWTWATTRKVNQSSAGIPWEHLDNVCYVWRGRTKVFFLMYDQLFFLPPPPKGGIPSGKNIPRAIQPPPPPCWRESATTIHIGGCGEYSRGTATTTPPPLAPLEPATRKSFPVVAPNVGFLVQPGTGCFKLCCWFLIGQLVLQLSHHFGSCVLHLTARDHH